MYVFSPDHIYILQNHRNFNNNFPTNIKKNETTKFNNNSEKKNLNHFILKYRIKKEASQKRYRKEIEQSKFLKIG